MTTIKSYTDLQQSKKLAEMLPLESADMFYTSLNSEYPWVWIDKHLMEVSDIPCWSVAALIDILPRFIEFKDDKYYLRFMKDYVEYANDEISITGRCLHTTGNDNLVDACVAMIEKLNELNLL
jgi:hypothetical protein